MGYIFLSAKKFKVLFGYMPSLYLLKYTTIFVNYENSFVAILYAPKEFEAFTPEEKQLMVIIFAIMNEQVDNESIRNYFEISAEKACTLIKTMMANKILQPSCLSRKYARYILTEP